MKGRSSQEGRKLKVENFEPKTAFPSGAEVLMFGSRGPMVGPLQCRVLQRKNCLTCSPFGLRYGKGCACAASIFAGAPVYIAASDIFSVGVDGGPICTTKRDRQALAANGSLKYCVSWATLPSLNSIMLTV